MGKEQVSFKNRDRFLQLGMAIAMMRRMRGLTQEELAEKADISRSHLSAIEAPGSVHGFSVDVLFNIADALDVNPVDLLNSAQLPDYLFPNMITKKNSEQ